MSKQTVKQEPAQRQRYQRPVVSHLGSVRQFTLATDSSP